MFGTIYRVSCVYLISQSLRNAQTIMGALRPTLLYFETLHEKVGELQKERTGFSSIVAPYPGGLALV